MVCSSSMGGVRAGEPASLAAAAALVGVDALLRLARLRCLFSMLSASEPKTTAVPILHRTQPRQQQACRGNYKMARLRSTRAGTAHHWPAENWCLKMTEEAMTERNWRAVMSVAKLSAPYVLMVYDTKY